MSKKKRYRGKRYGGFGSHSGASMHAEGKPRGSSPTRAQKLTADKGEGRLTIRVVADRLGETPTFILRIARKLAAWSSEREQTARDGEPYGAVITPEEYLAIKAQVLEYGKKQQGVSRKYRPIAQPPEGQISDG